MAQRTITILGLYNWNENIFDGLILPDGVDKNIVIDNILEECNELEVLYSDPDYMQAVIGIWSKRMLPTWKRLNETFNAEYNPLYNVDAYETITEDRDLHGTRDVNGNTKGKSTSSNNGTATQNGSSTENGTTTNQQTGYNSETFKNGDKTIMDDTTTTNASSTTNASAETNDDVTNTVDENTSDTGTITTTNRRYGNIGVTKSTDLVLSELEVRPKLNIYSYIVDGFKNKFCLLIY